MSLEYSQSNSFEPSPTVGDGWGRCGDGEGTGLGRDGDGNGRGWDAVRIGTFTVSFLFVRMPRRMEVLSLLLREWNKNVMNFADHI